MRLFARANNNLFFCACCDLVADCCSMRSRHIANLPSFLRAARESTFTVVTGGEVALAIPITVAAYNRCAAADGNCELLSLFRFVGFDAIVPMNKYMETSMAKNLYVNNKYEVLFCSQHNAFL